MDLVLRDCGNSGTPMKFDTAYSENGVFSLYRRNLSPESKFKVPLLVNEAVDLLKNVEVQAIIGPMYSTQANFLIALGHKAQVPIITFSASSPSLSSIRSPYFIRATLSDSSQVQAIGALIQAFGWREVVAVYEDNEFGEGIMPYLSDALEHVNTHIPYRSVIPALATDAEILEELYKLMSKQTRVFIVHMRNTLGSRLFLKAKELGMMSQDYAWIITDGMANELNSMDPSVTEIMLGVIGVQPYIPRTKELGNFTERYKKKLQQDNVLALKPNLNIFGLWAHDSAIALAMAAEKALLTNATFEKVNVLRNSTDLEAFGVSNGGRKLVQALSTTTFGGFAGKFHLADGQLQSPPYEVVNVIGPGVRVVGYWTKKHGIIRELNFTDADIKTYSTSKSNLGSVIWPGDQMYPSRGWVIPTSGKKLKVGVPFKIGFTEFVRVTWNPDNSSTVEGYCIDVFDAVMAALPYGVPYEYAPFTTSDHKRAGTYNDLTYQVHLGNYDAVAGDVTILANRSQYVDFTLPYMASGVSMVVPLEEDKSKNAWVFIKPLTWELWLASFCSFVFIGVLIWILEHRINEDFRGPRWHQVGMIFWFAFSTVVFAHKERVISNLSRFVLIIWFLMVLILTQSYTASLTSMLTVQQLQPAIKDVNVLLENKDYVGYMKGSFVHGLLRKMNFDESRLVAFNSPEEMDQLLSKGSGNGGIAAAFHEIPYLKVFLSNYCSKYIMVDQKYKADGFGFVFPIGSPLVRDVSRSILTITESTKMEEIERKWLGYRTNCQDSLDPPRSLGLGSFWGLFSIVGVAGISAFTIYLTMFLHEHWHVIQRSDPDSTIWSKMSELLGRFNNRDLKCHTFKNVKLMDKDNGCGANCRADRSIYPPLQTYQQSPSNFSPTTRGSNCPPSPSFSSPENLDFLGDHASSVENGSSWTTTEQDKSSHTWLGSSVEHANMNPPTEVSQTNKQEIELLARQDEIKFPQTLRS
ncbi:glutamate receptor 2.8-like [Dorcoceras hygrometricum]|uniref:Glutamate receptor n=1 Tax=Dorcoceras hygrometricum TaxID=472368 RepID=A0A2Z7APY3_9LAMI|nr:glutamate receptor 2.8-like [Dorcoceras hygrometricum]